MKKRRMSKKAQFFIIGAVILGVIILSIAGVWNVVLKGKEDVSQKKFQALCENYKREVFEISKYAIASGNKSNESGLILDFTIKFLEYAKTSEPNFKMLYVYGNSTNVTVFSYTNTLTIIPSMNLIQLPNGYFIGNIESATPIETITIADTNINKQYEIVKDERFYFVALEEKDDERYICE